jgi:hypothetical protein
MVTICLLIAIGAIVYYYLHAHPRPSEPKCKYGCPVPKPKKPGKPSNVIYEDDSRLLSFEADGLSLRYKGQIYRFACQPHEPMAIILKSGEAVVYIHNAFDVTEESRCFLRNPDYQCHTITGEYHDAERFCLLLTTAIDGFYECQLNEVEQSLFASRLRLGRKDYRYKN